MKNLNILPIHIPVGESILNKWHILTYPELLEYKNIILAITPENFNTTVKLLTNNKQNIALPMCIAAELGNYDLIVELSKDVDDINTMSQVRTSAALTNNPQSINIIKFLTEKYNMKFSQAILYNAANSNNMELIEYLYSKYSEMTKYEIIHSVLKTAKSKGSEETAEILADILRNTPQPSITNLEEKMWTKSAKNEYLENLKKINEQKKIDEEQKEIQERFKEALIKSQNKEISENLEEEDIIYSGESFSYDDSI